MKLAFCLTLLLAAMLPAQTHLTLPPDSVGKDASGATNVPLGRSVPMRAQMAYGKEMFAWTTARAIQALAFRSDGLGGSGAKKIELQTYMSTMAGGLGAVSSTFANNRGKDQAEVCKRKQVSLPILPLRTKAQQDRGPAGFEVNLPLDRAFTYGPSKGNLLVEMLVHKQPRGSYRLDATWLCDSPLQYVGPAGCGRSAPAIAVKSLTSQLMWGHPATLRIENVPAGAATMLMFGSRSTGTWEGLTLPWHASSIGAPGCYLSVDILALSRGKADTYGKATYGYTIPAWPGLKGLTAYVQALAEDPRANALGLVTSQAARLQICGWEPVARVFANGLSVTQGYQEIGVAPVLRLTTK